jgi:hypothetical protein
LEELVEPTPHERPKVPWNGHFKGDNQPPLVFIGGVGKGSVGNVLEFPKALVGLEWNPIIYIEHGKGNRVHLLIG